MVLTTGLHSGPEGMVREGPCLETMVKVFTLPGATVCFETRPTHTASQGLVCILKVALELSQEKPSFLEWELLQAWSQQANLQHEGVLW